MEDRRLAKNYAMVYEVVCAQGAGKHLTAAQVLAAAKARRPGIGETTVYRALGRLRELGLISEIALPGAGGALYERAAGAHAHFQCEQCGAIDDVDYALPPPVLAGLERARGGEIAHARVSFHGRCASCRAKQD
ncbi:MAG: Fur family transcriptional regulator [Candidatus Baltobacteraceae bacterium]